jgi:glycosyltransferase involved in cell wall biosynthesis
VNRHGLEGKFVAAYIGTVGMAHGLETILDAAEKLAPNKGVAFVVVGDGAEHSSLQQETRRRELSNVVFVGRVSKDEVLRYWRLADVALVLLRDRPVFRHVLPSKIFEAMATARPIVLGVLGESAELLKSADAGIVIQPESASALAAAITRLAADPQEAGRMGANGRRFVENEFDRDKLAAAMLDELRAVAGVVA